MTITELAENYVELPCGNDVYWNILGYLNGLKGSREPKASNDGNIRYFFENSSLVRVSRNEEKIFLCNVSPELKKELERRLGAR